MAKKTIEQLQAEALKAEQKAKRLRAQARKMTKAEEAKTNAEIIKTLRKWYESVPEERRIAWSDLPQYLDQALK